VFRSTKNSSTIKWNHRGAVAEGLIIRQIREGRLTRAGRQSGFT
jgi:hypothetical protein